MDKFNKQKNGNGSLDPFHPHNDTKSLRGRLPLMFTLYSSFPRKHIVLEQVLNEVAVNLNFYISQICHQTTAY